MQVYVTIAVLMHVLLTVGSIVPWHFFKKAHPGRLPLLMFLMIGTRFCMSLVMFLVIIYLMDGDARSTKLFAIIYLAMYLLMVVIDTAYFYCSSKQLRKTSDKPKEL